MYSITFILAVGAVAAGVAAAPVPPAPSVDAVAAPPPNCVRHCGGLKHNINANRHLLHDDKGRVRVKDVPGLAPPDPPHD